MGNLNCELLGTIPTGCVLGEGPVWDKRIGALWLTDIQQAQLLRCSWPSGAIWRYDLPERLGSLGLTADPERLVCAFESEFALFEPATGERRTIAMTEPRGIGVRMNDGRIDRAGRFWAGSMVEDERLAPRRRGSLYRLDGDDLGSVVRLLDGVTISNSIAFSPDGERVYFADTPSQEIRVFECEPQTGALGADHRFAALTDEAFPDGSDVDAAGRLWNAEWGSGRVTVYDPCGTVAARIDLPVSQATCIAFGGRDLDLLFVTTAREGLSEAQLQREPLAGDVLIYRTNAAGLPAPHFAS